MPRPTEIPSFLVLCQNPRVLLVDSPGSASSVAPYCCARLSCNCHMLAPQLQGARYAEETGGSYRRRYEDLSQGIISLCLASLQGKEAGVAGMSFGLVGLL